MTSDNIVLLAFVLYLIIGQLTAVFYIIAKYEKDDKPTTTDTIQDYIIATTMWPVVLAVHAALLYKKLMK